MSDKSPEAPKIEFPCDYPIKVICNGVEGVVDQVVAVVRRHDPALDADNLVVQDSKNGRFQSLRLIIRATSAQQLQQLHVELKATGQVHMVL